MPINQYSTPTGSTAVRQYVPLPQQQLHAAIVDTRNRRDQYVELQDDMQRNLDQVARLSNRPDDQAYYDETLGLYDERIQGLAQQSVLDGSLPRIRAMARQAQRDIKPLADRSALVQRQREILEEQGWSGPQLTMALNDFVQNRLPELNAETASTGQYTANPYNYSKAVDISEEARSIAGEFQKMTGQQALDYLNGRIQTLKSTGDEGDAARAQLLERTAQGINLRFQASPGNLLERDVIDFVPADLLQAAVSQLLQTGESGNYINDLAGLYEAQGVDRQTAINAILEPSLRGVTNLRGDRANVDQRYRARPAPRAASGDSASTNLFRRTNIPGLPLFGRSISDGIETAKKLASDGDNTKLRQAEAYVGALVDRYNATNEGNPIENKDQFIADFIENNGDYTVSTTYSRTGQVSIDRSDAYTNQQFDDIRRLAEDGLSVDREALALNPEAAEDFVDYARTFDLRLRDPETGEYVEDENIKGNIIEEAKGVSITPPSDAFGNSEVRITYKHSYKDDEGIMRDAQRTVLVELDDHMVDNLAEVGLADDPALLQEFKGRRRFHRELSYDFTPSNVEGVETKLEGINNVVARDDQGIITEGRLAEITGDETDTPDEPVYFDSEYQVAQIKALIDGR